MGFYAVSADDVRHSRVSRRHHSRRALGRLFEMSTPRSDRSANPLRKQRLSHSGYDFVVQSRRRSARYRFGITSRAGM